MDHAACVAYFRARPLLCRVLMLTNRFLPYIIAVMFFCGGVYLLHRDGLFTAFFYFLIPAVKFIIATVLRAVINAPRPYDAADFEPLASYERGKGKSFPSRHTASAFAIARAFWAISPIMFAIGAVLAVIVGVCRVLCGCHYPKDVMFALLFLI